jgi:uncharacterized protein (DUF2062 family)
VTHGSGSFWQRRVVAPILAQLRQGITPEKIALTLALGGVLGVFPILGACTVLCAVAGVALRLNQPIIQLVNYFMYPVQLLLLIPFYRAGEWLFGSKPVPIVNIPDLMARFGADPWQFVIDYGRVGLYGITVWALLAPAAVATAYFVLKPALTAMAGVRSAAGGPPPPAAG